MFGGTAFPRAAAGRDRKQGEAGQGSDFSGKQVKVGGHGSNRCEVALHKE